MEEVKICTKCKEPKELSEFNETSNLVTSLRGDCKKCQRKYAAAHYAANKEKYFNNQRIRRSRNKKLG